MIGREPRPVDETVAALYLGYVTEERIDSWRWWDEPRNERPEGTAFIAFMREREVEFVDAAGGRELIDIEKALDMTVEAVGAISHRDRDDALRLAGNLVRRLVKEGIGYVALDAASASAPMESTLLYALDS